MKSLEKGYCRSQCIKTGKVIECTSTDCDHYTDNIDDLDLELGLSMIIDWCIDFKVKTKNEDS